MSRLFRLPLLLDSLEGHGDRFGCGCYFAHLRYVGDRERGPGFLSGRGYGHAVSAQLLDVAIEVGLEFRVNLLRALPEPLSFEVLAEIVVIRHCARSAASFGH
jgi:hypothetical protein